MSQSQWFFSQWVGPNGPGNGQGSGQREHMMSWTKLTTIGLLGIILVLICLTFEVWAAAFLGLVFALCLNGPAQWLRSRWPMPAWAATTLTIAMVLVVLTGLGLVIGPPLVRQADEMGRTLPAAAEKSLDWLEQQEWGKVIAQHAVSFVGQPVDQTSIGSALSDSPAVGNQAPTTEPSQQQPQSAEHAMGSSDTGAVSDTSNEVIAGSEPVTPPAQPAAGTGGEGRGSTDQARSVIIPIVKTMFAMISVTGWHFMLVVISLVITVFIALNPEVYRRGVMWLIPVEHEAVAKLTMSRMCTALRWWMLGRLASMLVIGLLTSLGMWMIGMPSPLALGTLAGLLSFVPNAGPILAGAPGVLLALPEGPWMVFAALSVYMVTQAIDSELISPLVDQYTITIPPAVLIITQIVMAVLTGAWGVLIATPLLVVVLVLTQQLYVREYLKKPIKAIGTTDEEVQDGANQPKFSNILLPYIK